MATPLPTSSSTSAMGAEKENANPKRRISFFRNVMKQKHSYIQFFAMSGILLLSVRSLGQKYRIHDLQEDTAALRDEQLSLSDRINNIKSSLRREAALDSSGLFAARLRLLFGNDE